MTIIPTIWKPAVTHTGLKILFSSLIKLVTLKPHEVTGKRVSTYQVKYQFQRSKTMLSENKVASSQDNRKNEEYLKEQGNLPNSEKAIL